MKARMPIQVIKYQLDEIKMAYGWGWFNCVNAFPKKDLIREESYSIAFCSGQRGFLGHEPHSDQRDCHSSYCGWRRFLCHSSHFGQRGFLLHSFSYDRRWGDSFVMLLFVAGEDSSFRSLLLIREDDVF